MNLSDVGNLASIVGLIITLITFLLAIRVNSKVNTALKAEKDRSYFENRVKRCVDDLKIVKDFFVNDELKMAYATMQYAKVNTAINLVNSSWDVLLKHENILKKKCLFFLWDIRLRKLMRLFREESNDAKEVLKLLEEFITFLEKEQN